MICLQQCKRDISVIVNLVAMPDYGDSIALWHREGWPLPLSKTCDTYIWMSLCTVFVLVVMDCMLLTCENRVPLMRYRASVVWHHSLPLLNSFNKTMAAVPPMQAMLPKDFPFFSDGLCCNFGLDGKKGTGN